MEYEEDNNISITPKSVDILLKIKKIMNHGWVYRGHSNVNYKLETTLERAFNEIVEDENIIGMKLHIEDSIIKDFKRKAHHYLKWLPSDADKLGWLSLIQHYGGPTRLLDFTESFYVALYFANKHLKGDSAIWCINKYEVLGDVTNKFTFDAPNIIDEYYLENVNNLLSGLPSQQCVFAVEPFRLHERLIMQKGLFLLPYHLDYSTISNLSKTVHLDEAYIESDVEIEVDDINIIKKKISNLPILKIVIKKRFTI